MTETEDIVGDPPETVEDAVAQAHEELEAEASEETSEVELEDTSGVVPVTVQKYRPEEAKVWAAFSEEQRQTIISGVDSQIDLKPEEPTPTEEAQVEPERPTASEPAVKQPGEVVPENDIRVLIDELGLDANSPAATVIRALDARSREAYAEVHRLVPMVSGALTEQNQRVLSVEAGIATRDALVRHEPELRLAFGPSYSQADMAIVATKAQEIVTAGRTNNIEDAMSLAIREAKRDKPQLTQEDRAKRAETKQVAGSLSGSGRTHRPPQNAGKIPQNMAEACAMAKDEIEAEGAT